MPQLDFANPLTLSQVVWMVIIFAALYVLLARWALPQVASVVEGRAARIAADLDTARLSKASADAAIVELTDASRRATADAQGEIARAVAAAKAEAAEQARAANEQLDQQLAGAEQRIQAARSAALGALRQVAAETASVIVTRLTQAPADQMSIDVAVGHALAARG